MDLYDTILPVYILSKILGLAPIKLIRKNGSKRYVSSFGLIIIIRFIVVLGSMIYVAVLINELNLRYDLKGVALRCELFMGSILTATMLIEAVRKRFLLISIVEDLLVIDKKMEQIGINILYKNAKRFSTFQILGITCVFISKAIMQPFTSERAFISIYNIFNIVDYINTITLFQYVDLLLLLRQRYIWLNRKLKLLTKLIIKEVTYEQLKINKIQNKEKVTEVLKIKPEIALNILSRIHNDLFDISRKINMAYSLRLLVTVGMRFVMIITQLLTVYKMIIGRDLSKKPVTFVLIGIYLFLHTSKVFMILSISSNTADKANQTGVLLHNVWKCNSNIMQQINYFSLQILQQNIHFDAEGYFTMNYELIYSITAALTVYLMILIQFDASTTNNKLITCSHLINNQTQEHK